MTHGVSFHHDVELKGGGVFWRQAGAATVVLVLAAVLVWSSCGARRCWLQRVRSDLAVWLPQVLAPLAVSFSARAVQQAANTRRRACSTWRESASESARDARGKTAGTRALLLLAVVALLLQGVTASEPAVCVKSITAGYQHTCSITVRKCPSR